MNFSDHQWSSHINYHILLNSVGCIKQFSKKQQLHLPPAHDRWTIAYIIKIQFFGLKYDDEYVSNLYNVE